jgi:anaerobic dimethyl sulfoxide reductase subunit C
MNLREWALPAYTILMQLATGTLLVLWTIRSLGLAKFGREQLDRLTKRPILILFFTVATAVLGAHLHLSQPFLSFLAVANLRSSWLSREILFTVLSLLSISGLAALQWSGRGATIVQTILGWSAILMGAASTFCMSMIYLLPTQPIWNSVLTVFSFFATSLLLGVMAMLAMLMMDLRFSTERERGDQAVRIRIIQGAIKSFAIVALLTTALILIINFVQINILEGGDELAKTSLELLLGLYRSLFILRFGLLIIGVAWLLVVVGLVRRRASTLTDLLGHAYVAFLLVLVSEILGRFLFYAMHVRIGI